MSLPQLIIPMPLHASRLKERGFNQAIEIARPISRTLSIPLDYTGSMRKKSTPAQSGLASSARKSNIKNAFIANRNYDGLAVAVLDDVITTGSTMNEFCHLLQAQGAKTIDVWCCARVF
jgi:ComF family protein